MIPKIFHKNSTLNNIIFLLILILLFIIVFEINKNIERIYQDKLEDKKLKEVMMRKPEYNFNLPIIEEEKDIPKNIIQTYKSKDKIPQYVFNNLKNKNKDYNYYFYDDEQCEAYIKEEYGSKLLKKYKSIKKGAHRADIFRLCWLYKNGGIYCDIDVNILMPLDKIIEKMEGNNISIPITHKKNQRKNILNAMIIVNKGNPLIRECLQNMLKVNYKEIDKFYFLYLLVMKETLENKINYHFLEINEGMHYINLLEKDDWFIKDKKGNKLAKSKYDVYQRQKGFK